MSEAQHKAAASMPSEEPRAITLMQLPDDALAIIALHLSLKSLVNFACTCTLARQVALEDTQFQTRLMSEYNLGIQAIPFERGCYEVYRQLHTQASHSTSCRFQAVSTDGGVDKTASAHMVFWVDNMFADDHDESYCSEIGGPVTTFGLLLADEPEQDVNRKRRGRLARLLLETPLQLLRPSVPETSPMRRPLRLWSLPELETLLSEFWGPNLAACGPWLAGSFDPVAQELGETASVIKERARQLVLQFRLMRLHDPHVQQAMRTPEEQRMTPIHLRHPHFSVAADPRNPRLVYDTRLMPWLLQPPQSTPHHIAVLSQVSVSRKGGFSCPVRTGAVLACVHVKAPTSSQAQDAQDGSHDRAAATSPVAHRCRPSAAPEHPHQQINDISLKASYVTASTGSQLVNTSDEKDSSYSPVGHEVKSDTDKQTAEASSICEALANLTPQVSQHLQLCRSFDALQDMVGQMLLPPVLRVHVHRGQSHFCGVTVEFEAPSEGCVQTLSPICWFQFFSKEEDAALKAWEAMVLEARQHEINPEGASTSTGTAGKLPAALRWVERFFDPRPATATSARTDLQEPSCSSLPCNQFASDDESVVSEANSSETLEGTGVGLFDGDGEDNEDEPDAWSSRDTLGRSKLQVRLLSKRPANLTSVLLIDEENLMELWRDLHPDPNIDISYVRFKGSIIQVPAGTNFNSCT